MTTNSAVAIAMILNVFISVPAMSQNGNDWKVWVKTDPCAGRHDWISVAKENPTSFGLSFYESANFLFPQTACTTFGCSFAEATRVANTLKFTDEYFDYCCRDYSVWENMQTKKRNVVLGNFGTPGLGWFFIKGDLCCEEAELLAGIPGTCSGNHGGNNNQGNTTTGDWKVWVKTSPCSGRHDWISVAKEDPTPFGLNFYQSANMIFPQTACTTFGCSFDEATRVANTLKLNNLFFNYCCRDYSVWEHTQTKAKTVVLGKFGNPGLGWFFIKGDLCCEEAENLAGIQNACSGRDQIQCWPGSYAAWNPQTQKMECFCNPGLVWDPSTQSCIPSVPDCPRLYANSEALWDATTNQYLCYCKQGFVWNDTRTACIPSKPDCNLYYKNSYAVWDAVTNNYKCECNPGYVWDAAKNECVSNNNQVPDCNLYYKNSYAAWDASINNYRCHCNQGYVWDASKNECVSQRNEDNPIVKPELQKNGECNIQYQSGANEPEQYTIDVKRNYGNVNFSFQTYDVKDRIHIYQSGSKVFDSGCVGTSGSQTLTLNGVSSVFTIIVDPRCDQDPNSTSWNFTLGCPN